jgi:hypothetical protein
VFFFLNSDINQLSEKMNSEMCDLRNIIIETRNLQNGKFTIELVLERTPTEDKLSIGSSCDAYVKQGLKSVSIQPIQQNSQNNTRKEEKEKEKISSSTENKKKTSEGKDELGDLLTLMAILGGVKRQFLETAV